MITEHTICALPEDHADWYLFAIKVQRRTEGRWVLNWCGYYYCGDPDRWYPDITEAVQVDEERAVELAEGLAPTIEVNGITVAQALARADR